MGMIIALLWANFLLVLFFTKEEDTPEIITKIFLGAAIGTTVLEILAQF